MGKSFISIILCYKYLGKNGLFLWIVVAIMLCNIQTIKTIVNKINLGICVIINNKKNYNFRKVNNLL